MNGGHLKFQWGTAWVCLVAAFVGMQADAATRYKRLEELYNKAGAVSLKSLYERGPMLWVGKCVRMNAPEKLIVGQMGVYPEFDEVLGQSVFVRAEASGIPVEEGREKEAFETLSKKLENSCSAFEDETNKILRWNEYNGPDLQNIETSFGLRIAQTKSGLSYLILLSHANYNYQNTAYLCYFLEERLGGGKGPKGEIERETSEVERSDLN